MYKKIIYQTKWFYSRYTRLVQHSKISLCNTSHENTVEEKSHDTNRSKNAMEKLDIYL